jgi:hypothetical protein
MYFALKDTTLQLIKHGVKLKDQGIAAIHSDGG